jgi:hypothetical protein
MHFPRYWIIAERGQVSAWGWSDESPAQAEAQAVSRVDRILEWLRRGEDRQAQRYGYGDRPMREEVLKEFRAPDGTLTAAVTRNSYGCLVLNTATLMFVDVDAPQAKESGFLAGLFGFRRPDKSRQGSDFEAGLRESVNRWLASHPTWGWRLYRTRAGMRLVATHEPVGPDDPQCREAFEWFAADPLYRRLCASQKCFRARLTPKPWRCGGDKPRHRWPWKDAKAEAAFQQWEHGYMKAAGQHATCELQGQFGKSDWHPALAPLIDFHDTTTRATAKLPLA